jgi:hypothetical protein
MVEIGSKQRPFSQEKAMSENFMDNDAQRINLDKLIYEIRK